MKIRIRNLGPINSYEFDLTKDLNVIFGKNNIGKSYAISAVYLIIKNLVSQNYGGPAMWDFLYSRHLSGFELSPTSKNFNELDEVDTFVRNEFQDRTVAEIDVTNRVEKILSGLIQQSFVVNLEKSFNASFLPLEELSNKLTKDELEISLEFDGFAFTLSPRKNHLSITNLTISDTILIKRSSTNRRPLKSDGKHTVYFNEKNKDLGLFEFVLTNFFVAFRQEVRKVIGNVYFLPASRSGLYQALSAFSAVIAELSKSRNFLSNSIQLPSISEPVADYFLYLSKIRDRKATKKYSSVTTYIENEVLGGKVTFNKETNKIVFAPKLFEAEIDLAYTSSMVSEIAPIVAFLKYIISFKDKSERAQFTLFGDLEEPSVNLLFIEEPEAHLHPTVQVKMMQLFVELIKLDVKIVMTSHSNYMFNKLSNLILADDIEFQRVGSYLMKMTETGSISDSVSMRADDEGIRDENFADTSESLYEERISIYDKLNSNASRRDSGK